MRFIWGILEIETTTTVDGVPAYSILIDDAKEIIPCDEFDQLVATIKHYQSLKGTK